MSGEIYQVPCFFIGVDVNLLVEGTKLIDLAGKRSLLELPVSDRDVALLGVEEAPSSDVSTRNPSPEVYDSATLEMYVQQGILVINPINHIMLA